MEEGGVIEFAGALCWAVAGKQQSAQIKAAANRIVLNDVQRM